MKNYLISSVFTVMTCLLAGCAHPPAPTKAATPSNEDGPAPYAVNLSKIHNAIPKSLPRSKYGNPREYMALGKRYHVLRSANGYDKVGFASWYGWKFHKHLTSSRESYDMFAMTAASPTLPIPTFVKVTNLKNGRWVIVKVNDRGPFKRGRILDLTYAAAEKLGYANQGTTRVRVTAINPRKWKIAHRPKPLHQYIQVGSFISSKKAEHAKIKISHLTQIQAKIHLYPSHKHHIYRVRIGPFKHKHTLTQIRNKLKKLGIQPILLTMN